MRQNLRWVQRGMLALLLSAAALAEGAPDLNGGIWRAISPSQSLRTLNGKEPPLLPEAKAIYAKRLAARKAGDLSFDGTQQCKPPGLPRLLSSQPGAFEFLQRPEEIIISYEWNRLLRIVAMNVPQPEPIGPAYQGQSVGRWDGDTLVIDTISFQNTTMLDDTGLPHSDALHLTERYVRSRDGKRLTVLITIEDPKTYSAPWQTKLEFRHDPNGVLPEDVCIERTGMKWGKLRNAQ